MDIMASQPEKELLPSLDTRESRIIKNERGIIYESIDRPTNHAGHTL